MDKQGSSQELASGSDAKSSTAVLTHGGRASYVSQSGLASVLKQVREHGMPEGISRSAVKRSRDRALPQDLWTEIAICQDDHGVTRFPAVHPWKFLQAAVRDCKPLEDLISARLQAVGCTLDRPWGVALYSDEIVPGNALKPRNDRKLIAFYWALVELGRSLSGEEQWYHIATVRSSKIREASNGWAQMFSAVCKLFFTPPMDAALGIPLTLRGQTGLFFAQIALVIADEAALKSCWNLKGASGTKPCFFCQNVTLHHLKLHEHDATGRLQSHTQTDVSKLALETDGSVVEACRHLEREAAIATTKARLDRVEKALGINHMEGHPLSSQELAVHLRGGPITVTQMDWMHIYCVSGIFNTEGGYLMDSMKDAGFRFPDLDRYLQEFHFPKQIGSRGTSGCRVLKGYDGGELKCSASESLSVYVMIRLMLMQLVPNNAPADLAVAVLSFYALANVLDLLLLCKFVGGVAPSLLQEAICNHLDLRLRAFGPGKCQPKCHYAMHLASMLASQPLLTCWVHERKHKELKRYGSDSSNANRTTGYEKGLLQQCVLNQLEVMKGVKAFDSIYLVHPAHADAALATEARRFLQCSPLVTVLFAHDCYMVGGRLCAANDLALADLESTERVVEIWYHLQVGEQFLSVVSPLEPAGVNQFKKMDAPVFIFTGGIKKCVIYRFTENPEVVAIAP